ncbi:MAG: insulinase family protein [Bacteroidetes bacterium]|nr:insulinase family protein [Bacteroidota bacterium]
MTDRSKMPVSGFMKDVQFPEYREHVLANGMKVFFVKDDKFPVTTCRFLVKSGSYFDFFSNGRAGLATVTAEMLNRGTRGKTYNKIAETIDYNGALMSNGAGYDASFLSLSCLKKNFTDMFGLVSEMMTESVFPEEELSQKKSQLISSLISLQDEGAYLAERAFLSILYRGTPYEMDPDGYPDSVKGITRDDVTAFARENYTSENMILGIVGDFDEKEIIKSAENKFSRNGDDKSVRRYEFPNKSPKPGVYIIKKKDAFQASLQIGHAGIKRGHPDYIKTHFLNTLFGGMFTSRINKNLREVNGLTYGARTSFNCKKYAGDFSIETEVNEDKTGFAVEEIIKEMNLMRDVPVQEEELTSAKNYITGNFPLQLETSNNVAGKLLSLELYGADRDFYNHYISSVNALTVDDITETAQKYFRPEELIITAAGNPGILKKQLGKFGVTEIIDKVK